MFSRKLIIILLLCAYSTISYPNDKSDFDEICRIYTEARNSNMTIEILSKYIFDNVKERIHSKEALEAHAAVMYVGKKSRYNLFQDSAEHTLKQNWNCEAMEAVMKMEVK